MSYNLGNVDLGQQLLSPLSLQGFNDIPALVMVSGGRLLMIQLRHTSLFFTQSPVNVLEYLAMFLIVTDLRVWALS